MAYRINGFDQIKAFYSSVFSQEHDIKPQHVSLYVFLINQNNRNNWVEWFKCPFDLAMAGACIGNKNTYYKCLDDLQRWGFIKYQKGVNNWKAPKIKIEVLKCTATDTASVPQSEPLLIKPPQQLLMNIYKHITNKVYNNKQLIELRDACNIIIDGKDEKKFNFKESLISLGVERQIASDWLKVRSKKRASNTETAFNRIKSQIEISGINANECIKKAVERSWQGFEAEWMINTNTKQNGSNTTTETRTEEAERRHREKFAQLGTS